MELNTESSQGPTETATKEKPTAAPSLPAAPAVQRSGPGWAVAISICLVASLAMSALTVYVYDQKFAQKIVSVDIKGYVAKQGEDFMAGKITEEQFRQRFDHLQRVVEAIPPNKAVLMGDLVVRNVEAVKP